ncbi:MAG: hypothetical protein CMJ49_01700 [Planctomycetaceae bacterium]|nr:hypothetical protein [Planctomycetaceae bacterium]
MSNPQIIDECPFDDGVAAGRALGREALAGQTREWLDDPLLCDDLGAMSEAALARRIVGRLETEPDDGSRPELAEVYPDRVDYVRGVAEGAGCTIEQAALHDYVQYVRGIRDATAMMRPPLDGGGCSGAFMVGPDGVLTGQNIDSGAQHRPPDFGVTESGPVELTLKRPRSGYICDWGLTNEVGLAAVGAGGSVGTWLDEPVVDVWPYKTIPLTRFARNVGELADLCERYRTFNPGRGTGVWADVTGAAVVVEESHRRVGIAHVEDDVAWATEGNFQTDSMSAYIRERRLAYVKSRGRHLGANDLQYATDCAVRYCHLGELTHRDLGRGMDHMRAVLTDHAPFPRAVCRHGGPDTDEYDQTITLQSTVRNLTTNRAYARMFVPGKKFCCEVPEVVMEYPPRPFDKT